MKDAVIAVRDLKKTFRKPFSRTKVEAVRGISFEVPPGEIFGFLGPNGAGKTTTMKMLTGLISPTSGSASILGKPIDAPDAMARVGFLPENPYIYPYLTPREFVTLCARLSGVPSADLDASVARCIERAGMTYAMDRPARSLSKGMLQRTGVAAAIVHDPDLLILDEPMSGLDPVGRKEIRDLVLEESARGKTIFFSSHILSDVELLCDRVCILKRGEVVVSGAVSELLDAGTRIAEVTVADAPDELSGELEELADAVKKIGRSLVLEVRGDEALRAALEKTLASGARVESVTPKRETLEDVFVRRAL